MDHIHISYQAPETVHRIFQDFGDQIQSEVLAASIRHGAVKGYGKEWNINGEMVTLGVEKA